MEDTEGLKKSCNECYMFQILKLASHKNRLSLQIKIPKFKPQSSLQVSSTAAQPKPKAAETPPSQQTCQSRIHTLKVYSSPKVHLSSKTTPGEGAPTTQKKKWLPLVTRLQSLPSEI